MKAVKQSHGGAGFTLLEVLLAIFIFSLTLTSLFMLLSNTSRSFEKTTTRSDTLLQARGAVEVMSRDFRSVFFFDESAYNQTVQRLRDEIEDRAEAIEFDLFEGDDGLDDPNDARNSRTSGLPLLRDEEYDGYLLPPEIDLQMRGIDSSPLDQISFVTYQPNNPQGYSAPWGLRRVHYYVKDGTLWRTEDDVFKEYIGPDGELIAKPAPKPERIADGIVEFDLNYAYWSNGSWQLVGAWESGTKQYRNPTPPGFQYEYDLNAQEWEDIKSTLQFDNLPALIRIDLAFRASRGKGLIRRFRKSFRMYASQETHVPLEGLLPYADERRGVRSRSQSNSRSDDDRRGVRNR